MSLLRLDSWKGLAIVGVAAAIGAVLLSSVVLPTPSSVDAAEVSPRVVHVGIDVWPGYYPIVLADELGYFKDRDLRVVISIPEDTDRLLADFAAGEYDVIGASFADLIALSRLKPDVEVLLFADESAGADVILSRDPVSGPASIRGKRIGTNLGGFGEWLVQEFLKRHGVRPDEVTLLGLEGSGVPAALASGRVDLAYTWEPYVDEAVSGGATVVFSTKDTPHLVIDGLLTTGTTDSRRADEMRALKECWFRAIEYWRQNPESAEQIIEKRLGLRAGGGSVEGVRRLSEEDNKDLFGREGQRGSAFAIAEQYVEHFVRTGALTRRPEIGRLLGGSSFP